MKYSLIFLFSPRDNLPNQISFISIVLHGSFFSFFFKYKYSRQVNRQEKTKTKMRVGRRRRLITSWSSDVNVDIFASPLAFCGRGGRGTGRPALTVGAGVAATSLRSSLLVAALLAIRRSCAHVRVLVLQLLLLHLLLLLLLMRQL